PDLHAGIHLGEDMMKESVAQANALRRDLIVQTGDMIDISRSYIAPYVRAFRELSAPLGVVTVLGNHDRYTGERDVIQGCRDAGQVFVQNGCHVVERHGAVLALLGIDDPHNWTADDPQQADVDAALRAAQPDAFRVLLAHRPGAWDTAAPGAIQRELHSRVRLRPLFGRHTIDHVRHHAEPHAGPHLRGACLHRAVGLALRDQALEAKSEVTRGLAALLVQQVLVTLDEKQPGEGRLLCRPRHEPAGELGELLARPHLERVDVLDELSRPA